MLVAHKKEDNWLIFLQVGSRMVIVASGVIMILIGLFGKIGAIFSTVPTPVIGGMFLVMFGVIAAVGVSNLQVGKYFIWEVPWDK